MRRGKPLRRKSTKRRALDEQNADPRRDVLIDAEFWCEIRLTLVDAVLRKRQLNLAADDVSKLERAVKQCSRRAGGVHELRKRSSGGSLTKRENLMAACNICNDWVENEPELAHRLGLVVRPGDREWVTLGN